MRHPTRDRVFISYSHKDVVWLKMIRDMLELSVRDANIDLWDDTRIGVGAHFEEEIQSAIASAKVALLLVSPHFLDSEFIVEKELPLVVRAADVSELTLVWVAVSESKYETTLLSKYQAANDPVKPLERMERQELIAQLRKVCDEVIKAVRPKSKEQIWNVPFLQNAKFTGREELLSELNTSLNSKRNTTVVSALHGLAGVGKTQIAVQYAYLYRDKYEIIWWVRADAPANLALDFAGLAHILELPEKDAKEQHLSVEAVKRWLEHNSYWLLIFDNAVESAAIKNYLPKGGMGHVLITSRNPAWGSLGTTLTVPVLTASEAVNFFHVRIDNKDEDAAARLSETLGFLPLALEHAAAYVEETGCSLSQYLELFQSNQSALLKESFSTTEHASVSATWGLSLQKLQQESPPSVELLKLFAFFASDNIPLKIFGEEAHPTHLPELPETLSNIIGDRLRLNEAVRFLRRYSLVTTTGDELSIHRLIQTVVREQISKEDQDGWVNLAVILINCAIPREVKKFDNWHRIESMLSHVLQVSEYSLSANVVSRAFAILLNKIGMYLGERAEYRKALEVLTANLSVTRLVFGNNSKEVASALGNLAVATERAGDLDQAQSLLKDAFELCKTLYGKNDPRLELPAFNLGSFLRARGRLKEAEPCLTLAWSLAANAKEPDLQNQLSRANAMCALAVNKGEFETALKFSDYALQRAREIYDAGDPRLIELLVNRGNTFFEQGKTAAALPLLEEALGIGLATYGDHHPMVATIYNSIGAVQAEAGDLTQAKHYHERALQILEAKFEPHSHHLLEILVNLGRVLCRMDECVRGIEYLKRALKISRKHFGPKQPLAPSLKSDIEFYEGRESGLKALDLGDHRASLKHFSRMLKVKPNCEGYLFRGQANVSLKKYDAALVDVAKAVEECGDDDERPYNLRAEIHAKLQDYEAAEVDVTKAIELNPDVGESYLLLAALKYKQKDFPSVISALQRATELLPDNVEAFSKLGMTYAELGDYSAALDPLTKAIELDPNHASSYHWRGHSQSFLGAYEEALHDFERANELGFESSLYIGETNYRLGRYSTAIPYVTEAIEEMPGQPNLYFTRGACYVLQGEFAAGIPDLSKAIELSPETAHFYDWRGQSIAQLNNFPAALADLTRAISLQPANAEYYRVRGQIHSACEDDEAALADFEKAAQLDPQRISYRNWRGISQFYLGNYEAALEDLDKGLKAQNPDTGLYYFRGVANRELHDYTAAIEDLRKAIAFADEEYLYLDRAKCYLSVGNYDAALSDLHHSEKPIPVHTFWRAVTMLLIGDEINASKFFDEAAQTAAAESKPLLLAKISLMTGDIEKSFDHYSVALVDCRSRELVKESRTLHLLQRLFPNNDHVSAAQTFLKSKLPAQNH